MTNPPFIVRKGSFKDLIHGRAIRTGREFVIVYPQGGTPFIFDSLSKCPPVDLRNASYSVISRYITDKIFLNNRIETEMFSGTDLCLLMSTVIDDERAYIKAETKIVEALNRAISKILKDFAKLHSNVNLSSIDAQFDIELPDELKKLSGITIKSIKGSFVHGRLDADARYHYDFARASAALGPAEAEF